MKLNKRKALGCSLITGLTCLVLVGIYTSYLSYIGKYSVVNVIPMTKYETFIQSSDARDHALLTGWYLPAESCAVAIVVPGWSENRATFLDWSETWQSNGISVITYDPRGGTGHNTLGTRENGDLSAIIKWANEHGYAKQNIFLVAHSLGGIPAQQIAAQEQFGGLISVSSVYDVWQTRRLVLADHGLWFSGVFAYSTAFFDRYLYGIRTQEMSRLWRNIETPIFVLHSYEDEKASIELVKERLVEQPNTESYITNGNHRVFIDNKTEHQKAAVLIQNWINQKNTCQTTVE